MAEQFVGLTMLVTLSSPLDAQLRGRVSSVVAGQSLTLSDVYCPSNGKYITEITIQASHIKDLAEAGNENTAPNPSLQAASAAHPRAQSISRPKQPTSFEDPAIVSLGGRSLPRPRAITTPTPTPPQLYTPELDSNKPTPSTSTGIPPYPAQPAVVHMSRTSSPPIKVAQEQHRPATPLRSWRGGGGKGGGGYDNGWATEDATDVQDMGDFDFEASLSKFDKRTVFEGIRADDVTADEDRLVGHNRIPRPGTMGGRNLHPTENVLDGIGRAQQPPAWNSEAGDSEDAENMMGVSQRGSGSGRPCRRTESRLRMPMSKKETSSLHSQSRQSISVPRAKSRAPPSSPPQQASTTKSSFYLVPADRPVEVASALQMLNLENIANSELGLTEDMMTENAGRGIAGGGAGNTLPYVVIYAGNSKSGIRAIAAGRHLRNHGATVAICVLGLEREPELLEGVRRQLKVFRSFGGKVFTKIELMEYLKSTAVPVELIIDGLLGLTISFEELRTGDQATAFELIEWANRSSAAVSALYAPTGLDPGTGVPMVLDGRELWIQATLV
ncbi:hypothetical protein VE04_09852, partial [Pseudogymnoascus sp. 24MN13]